MYLYILCNNLIDKKNNEVIVAIIVCGWSKAAYNSAFQKCSLVFGNHPHFEKHTQNLVMGATK